jgi:hypothetical protein
MIETVEQKRNLERKEAREDKGEEKNMPTL